MRFCRKLFEAQKATVVNMEHVYCVLDKQSCKHTPKISNTFLFQLHERGSILRDISHVLLYLQVLWTKYHHNIHRLLASAPLLSLILVPRCSVYLDRWIQPTANICVRYWSAWMLFTNARQSIEIAWHWKFQNQIIFCLLQFNIQQTAIFTLFYLSCALFSIIILLTTWQYLCWDIFDCGCI